MEEQAQWTSPSPLWPTFGEVASSPDPAAARRAMQQPAVLRFASDSFMEDFTSMMETSPSRLIDFIAAPETWRGPTPPPDPIERVPRFLLKHQRWRLTGKDAVKESLPEKGSETTSAAQPQALLKLYQPAHQRYYIITGCLVCRRAGLPDKALQTNREERTTFVIRRLMWKQREAAKAIVAPVNLAEFDEYAFVTSPGNKGWQKISGSPKSLVQDEEQVPLFQLNFTDEDERQRRLFAGLIPVGKREAYMGAAPAAAPGSNAQAAGKTNSAQGVLPKTARKILLRSKVVEPWKRIIETGFTANQTINEPSDKSPTPQQKKSQLKEAREQLQISSWYVLLDLAKYLKQYVPEVWDAVVKQSSNSLARVADLNLFNALANINVPNNLSAALTMNDPLLPPAPVYTTGDIPSSLRAALRMVIDLEEKLDNVTTPYDREVPALAGKWPSFIFPLADPELPSSAPQLASGIPPLDENDLAGKDSFIAENNSAVKQAILNGVDSLSALVVRALPLETKEPVPPPPLASQPLLDPAMREGLFVVRCVYERPLCGPLDPPEVSEPTTPFQMAGYFDPDAPARPIRIALPLDTSPAGLRKFDKNTAFMISDVLCGQVQRLKSMTFGDLVRSVLPWPFHKDLSAASPDAGACKTGGSLEIGMICSLSLPIITICALLLLIIIVFLLDIVFKWIPYFFICFPVPGLKAKK
jgi:hypothetical protein